MQDRQIDSTINYVGTKTILKKTPTKEIPLVNWDSLLITANLKKVHRKEIHCNFKNNYFIKIIILVIQNLNIRITLSTALSVIWKHSLICTVLHSRTVGLLATGGY